MVNWYAIARYIREPNADPAQVKLDWAREEFGAKAAPVVAEIVDKVTGAARGMYEFDALWTACHSRFPTLEYLDCLLCGPYRQMKRIKGMMGLELPVDMYAPEVAAKIRANPRTRLVFNRVPITAKLKEEALAQKDGAVERMEQALALWRSLEGKIKVETYQRILAGLEGNRNDSLIFRHMMNLYMDWKLGVLTEARIDAVLETCRGLKGIVVPNPLDPHTTPGATGGGIVFFEEDSLASFAEKLRRDLRNPWMEKFWEDHPTGVS
jgi:hypothetical protein